MCVRRCCPKVSFVPPLSNAIDQMSASVHFDFVRLVLLDGCDILCIALHPVLDTVMEMAPFPGVAFQGNAVQGRAPASARRVLGECSASAPASAKWYSLGRCDLLLTEEISQVKHMSFRWRLFLVVVPPSPLNQCWGRSAPCEGGRPKRENIASHLQADLHPTLIQGGRGETTEQDASR